MTAITDLSDVVNKLTGGNNGNPQNQWVFINNRVSGAAAAATVAGRMTSLWGYEKNPGGSGAVPTSSAIPTNTTNGGMFQTNPSGGRRLIALGASLNASAQGSYLIYDRLVHMGGHSGTVTTAQTTNLPTTALTRNTSGEGNMIMVEIYSQIGATATTATIGYKNTAGTTKTSKAFAFGGTGLREAQRVILVPLADGDTGVTTIENSDLLATTATAGNYGMSIIRPLAWLHVDTTGAGQFVDFITGFPSEVVIEENACIGWVAAMVGTTAPIVLGSISMVEV